MVVSFSSLGCGDPFILVVSCPVLRYETSVASCVSGGGGGGGGGARRTAHGARVGRSVHECCMRARSRRTAAAAAAEAAGCVVSCRLMSSRLVSRRLASSCVVLRRPASSHVVPSRVASSRLVLSFLVSSHLISSHLALSCLVSPGLVIVSSRADDGDVWRHGGGGLCRVVSSHVLSRRLVN